MSSTRRSSRTRKTINYSKCGHEDSDDDFAESGSQPSKKTKLSKESTNKKTTQKKTADQTDKSIMGRVSVTDKVYQRSINFAMEISKKENISPSPETDNLKSSSLISSPTECSDKVTNMKINEVETCDKFPLKQRQATFKSPSKQQEDLTDENSEPENNDEDYSLNNASEDISDSEEEDENFKDDESDESEFELSSKKKSTPKKTSKVIKPTSNASKPKPRLSATVIPVSKTPTVNVSTSKVKINSTPSPNTSSFKISKTVTSPGQSLKSAWVPPGLAKSSNNSPGSISIRSPASSSLRVGLSRKQVLKPLHSSIKIQ